MVANLPWTCVDGMLNKRQDSDRSGSKSRFARVSLHDKFFLLSEPQLSLSDESTFVGRSSGFRWVVKCLVRGREDLLHEERGEVPMVKSGCCLQVLQHRGPSR